MAGQINRMIEQIIDQRSQGDEILKTTTKTKLILKGINPEKFTSASPDDPAIIAKLNTIAGEMGVRL
ncbi:hypothetical protein [Methanofollis fontis]|uniref:Uncharacterized protein n=1 Tax=Methanofollis fontis TaxID=2052832 RepID=A0A483CUK4_9EURY|nr:hypothetical protein [Methanofollis fontis]TAJ45296.1 hypothetical protein CUJ86_00685 [Methanofollis fontis]